MIYFISDTHFLHKNIIKYDNRPFSSIEEHDEMIIQNWNNTIGKNDTVYHLGDFSLGNPTKAEEIMKRLNGKINYIIGNHDEEDKRLLKRLESNFNVLGHAHSIKIDRQLIVLSHFPYQVWNKMHKGSFHLFGHSHGSLIDVIGRKKDVGVNCINYKPISYDEILLELSQIEIEKMDGH